MIGSLLPQASTIAPDVDALFHFILWTSVVSFLIIVFGKVFFIFWFWRKRRPEHATPYITGHTITELSVAFILLVWVMVIFYWGWTDYKKMREAPPNSLEINVTGRQWSWQFQYPDGLKTSELIVPKGRPVKLIMTSEDVLHSFFVPDFRVKQDLIPKVYTSLWFEATQTGEFPVFCAEYCGAAHSSMLSKVRVLEPEDFEEWQISGQSELEKSESAVPTQSPVEMGKTLFAAKGCQACHTVDGKSSLGPTLAGVFGGPVTLEGGVEVTVDENYLRESMMEPSAKVVKGFQPIMPTQKGQLTEEEIRALIDYIKSLKGENK